MAPKRDPSTRSAPTRSQSNVTRARTLTSRTTQQSTNDVDSLAENLASNLTLKGKQRAKAHSSTSEDPCTVAMRTVNTISKQLSAQIDKPSPRSTIKIADALKALRVLRDGRKGIDVERASSSLVGKLIALGKNEEALSLLKEMQPALAALYCSESCSPSLTSLPLPSASSTPSISDVLLSLITSYLTYSTQLSPQSIVSSLSDECGTLLAWLPRLSSVPSKQLDGALTKSYSVLSKVTSDNSSISASDIFRLQVYALKCLAHTTPGVLKEPIKFWSEVYNVIATASSGSNSDTVRAENILEFLSEIVTLVQSRTDAETFFETSTSNIMWPKVIDGWCLLAKKAGDVDALDRIARFFPAVASSSGCSQNGTVGDAKTSNRLDEALASQLCTLLAKVELSLGDSASASDVDVASLVTQTEPFVLYACAHSASEEEEKERKVAEKVYRALERVRRLSCKILDDPMSSPHRAKDILSHITSLFTSFPLTRIDARLKQNAIDALFALARCLVSESISGSVPPGTRFEEAFTLLDRAQRVLSPSREGEEVELLRLLANAFYAISGSLYKACHYDFAIRFLERACRLSARALTYLDSPMNSNADGEKEGWKWLRETLYKRYEVLGVCHSKIGDRKKAYEAFQEAICSFPYASSSTSSQGNHVTLDAQVANLVDRVTYMGICELFLNPEEVSLKKRMEERKPILPSPPATEKITKPSATAKGKGRAVPKSATSKSKETQETSPSDESLRSWRLYTGLLLERQIDSLETSRYKPPVRKAVGRLIEDALSVYENSSRRVDVLLKWLEYSYYEPEGVSGGMSVQVVVQNICDSLSESDSVTSTGADDSQTAQLIASAYLWHALHTHKANNPAEFTTIVSNAEQACKVLKTLLAQTQSQPRPSQNKFSLSRTSLGGAKRSPINQRKVGTASPLAKRIGNSPMVRKIVTISPQRKGRGKRELVVPAAPTKRGTRSRIVTSTSTTRTTRTTRTTGARVGKAAAVTNPVTPKVKNSSGVNGSDLPTETTPKVASAKGGELEIMPKLLDLLRMVSELLGLLGHAITRVHILIVIRRLCERNLNTQPDDYVQASIDLAHEYVNLGKTQRAANIYAYVYNVAKNAFIREETRVLYYLRYAELFGTVGNVLKGSSVYCEATAMADRLLSSDEKGLSTAQKVKSRVSTLERAAVAASTFAIIQYSKDDPTTSLNGLLQSLRLYHRASDTLTRLLPPQTASSDASNPFDMTTMKAALPTPEATDPSKPPPLDKPQHKSFPQHSSLSSLELRIASGLLTTLLSLTQAYFARGSAREAEYFAQQAHDLAESLRAPAMICRALSRMGEIKLRMGKVDEAHDCLKKAADLIADVGGVDAVDVVRLRGEVLMKVRMEDGQDVDQAKVMYEEAMKMLEELDTTFSALDGGSRKSLGASPMSPRQGREDTFAPSLLVAVLRQNIALLHGAGEEYKSLLERLRALPSTAEAKAEENALLAKLTLDEAYARFRADMFLSSLAESAISVPMGMTGGQLASSPTTIEILGTLNAAEKLFWSDLGEVARRGHVSHVRDSVVSLALIRAFQTSLGKVGKEGSTLVTNLLDSSASITLRREMLEAIQHKFPSIGNDDLQWPLLTPNGSTVPSSQKPKTRTLSFLSDEENMDEESTSLKSYWDFIASKYQSQLYEPASLVSSQIDTLPPHWTVVSMTLTSDENTLFLTRQRANSEPLIFCVPLKNRREADDEDEDKLTYEDAMNELKEIIRLSDEGTRDAVNVKRDDKNARAQWWAMRSDLDKRLKSFLENLEFCWLGAFKTILSEPCTLPPDVLAVFRSRLEKVFKRSLLQNPQDKKQYSRIRLSDTLLECFSTLSPTCDSEELEDIAYFILDLYQFHGVPVASSEVDMDHVTVELRTALEELSIHKTAKQDSNGSDEHLFLVVDKNLQGIPWESTPILRGRSVSRIPSLSFLFDRLSLARFERGEPLQPSSSFDDHFFVDARKTFFILNPSGDLKNTEGRFAPWLKDMKTRIGWDGIIGRAPSEQEFADALRHQDLVIYFGHGGAEQYIRSHKVRHLPRCAATMLWGCSSGALKEMGDFDRVGTPYHYMLSGCPSLVANLWDVTDRDIDKFSQAVFDKLHLTADEVISAQTRTRDECSIVKAIAQSREACKLTYLTGAAPVVYGIPFYL
ncbi:hypothetical protein QCA50_011248 [Cerrena zonata]|uniref:separase n=1 Tax=Cerrena zonata TaxID=2478898 RepID=A0AAW0G2N4_9APHY